MTVHNNDQLIKELEESLKNLRNLSKMGDMDFSSEITQIETKLNKLKPSLTQENPAWQKVLKARAKDRPTTLDYINSITDGFIEFHGDRCFADDKAIVGGIGFIGDKAVTLIGHQKGRDVKENIYRNFGMAHPEGYRKALRLMKQAEKFGRPIICFIDTPGAYCGLGAEERGQGEAIAKNLMEMSDLKVPVISIVIGEGGSGGALALGVANKIHMLENTIYSVLSPEGFASILWKDATRNQEAAEVMRITSSDLKEFDMIDSIIKEPSQGAGSDLGYTALQIKERVLKDLTELSSMNELELIEHRYNKFRKMGEANLR